MRKIIGLCMTVSAFAASCSSYTIDQCARDCSCQRVACCCGTGCDRTGNTIQYNACVPANSPYEQWAGCPSSTACSSTSGLIRTITPCVVPTPAPSPASSTGVPDIPFGTTFPMIGTQALSKQTWQHNVYMGTSMQFNPGAFWGYTDSYSVPNWNVAAGDGSDGYGGNTDSNGNIVTSAPTPVDATGRPCFGYSQPCPDGYYCKLNTGYNLQQKGTCQRQDSGTWTQGAGKFTDSSYYTGLSHPPLVLDQFHNGAASGTSGAYGSPYGVGTGSYGYPVQSGAGPETCAPLASGAPVCGFKSFSGTCFCDTDCSKTGDCCTDYANFCGVLSNQYSAPVSNGPSYSSANGPAYSPPALSCDAVGQCAGLCGSANPAIGLNGKPCYCDSQCTLTNDCCCSAQQCR